MKRKLSLLLYALMVTSWPYFIYLGIKTCAMGGDFLAIFILFFNWGFCFILIPMVWWGWYDDKPRRIISVGVILCLPIVYYQSFYPLMILNLVFGLSGIMLGLMNRPKPQEVKITPKARIWNLVHLLLILSLPVVFTLHYYIIDPQDNPYVFNYAPLMVPMIGLVVALVLSAKLFKEPIFTVFSLPVLLMAALTLNDFFLLRAYAFMVAIVGLASLLISLPKVEKQDQPV